MKLLLLKLLQPDAFAGKPKPKGKRIRTREVKDAGLTGPQRARFKPKSERNYTAPPRLTPAEQKAAMDYSLDPKNWK